MAWSADYGAIPLGDFIWVRARKRGKDRTVLCHRCRDEDFDGLLVQDGFGGFVAPTAPWAGWTFIAWVPLTPPAFEEAALPHPEETERG